MASKKSRTLVVQITAQLEVDYSPEELEEMGKSFREFKSGVERVVKAELLPAFQADAGSRVSLGTISYPSARKLAMKRKS
ncbi:hypothetical protein [Amphritea sp. HPY]|uniref:hypothetical protein n=1 Tax=Amphritea sp. HPY TaxID=3421652 RepID=UPI003D7CD176